MRATLLLISTTLLSAPALAQQQDPLAPLEPLIVTPSPTPAPAPAPNRTPAPIESVTNFPEIAPAPPPAPPRVIPRDWRGVFSAIDFGDWEGARLGIHSLPDGPLKPLARAELFTARGSPAVDAGAIVALLAEGPELPQAEQLARLAATRGAIDIPGVYLARATVSLGSAPRRGRTRAVAGEPSADALRIAFEPLVKIDDGVGAGALFAQAYPTLSYEARDEAARRVA
ncbi:MAG: hypothetical protein ACR2FK_05875, partial [Sphingomicrobium sp.]